MWAWRTAAIALLAALSAYVVELSIPAVVLCLIGFLALPPLAGRARHLAIAALALGSVAAGVGLVRFAMTKAIAGIVEGGQRAATNSALFRLREVLLAEDGMRKHAFIDPDGDAIGSAAFAPDLLGREATRTGRPLPAPLLNYRFRDVIPTREGPALQSASHLFIVCLPKAGGGFTARPGDPVDEELAERRFLAYAWPAARGQDVQTTIFLDEHERILMLDPARNTYWGREAPPPCDAALTAPPGHFHPWKDKKPRSTLPGDAVVGGAEPR